MMLFQEYPIFVPALAWIITHIIKVALRVFQGESLGVGLFRSGGMPSAHSAFIASVTAMLGLRFDIDDPIFVSFLAITAIVIYDAMNVRYQVGEHAKLLNTLVPHVQLPISIGHTPMEVLIGVTIGACCGFLLPILSFSL